MSGQYKSCPASGQMNERGEKERGDKNTLFKLSATGPWCLVCDSIGKFHFVISWNYRFAFPLPDCFGANNTATFREIIILLRARKLYHGDPY